MTDRERLEMIKHDLEELGQYGGFIDDCDTHWLIEQVEKLVRIKMISNVEDLTLVDFAKEVLKIIEGRETPTRKARS